MRKNRVAEQNRCYHLVSRLAHRAFFLDDEEKDRAVALMRRVEAGVQAIMSYCINRAVSISSDPLALFPAQGLGRWCAGMVWVRVENMGTHPLGKLDKLKRVNGYLINWMISVAF